MKKRVRQVLSLLCILALAFGCLTTAAADGEQMEARIIAVQWEDGNGESASRPEISVSYGDYSATLNADNQWRDEISVPAGDKGEWTCPESLEGYSVTKVTEGNVTLLIVRPKNGATTNVSASVIWMDEENAKGIRPASVQLALLADGKTCGEPLTVKAPGWKATWQNLPAKNEDGSEITYTAKQIQTPAGYTAAADGLKITNTLQTGKLMLKATVDGVPEDADVSKLRLEFAGADPSFPRTLTYGQLADGTFDFGDVLPGAYLVRGTNADLLIEGYVMDPENSKVADAVYLKPGETATLEFKYTYQEPEDYEVEEDYDPMGNIGSLTFEILGPDDRMPMKITYAEFTDGKFVLPDLAPGVYTVIERDAETLIRYYTLTSESVTGMTLTVSAGGTSTARLFNQYEPALTPEPDAEFVDIPVVKTWNDRNNADGNRPDSVTVRLYADGVEVDSHVLTAAEGWQYTFIDKPRYKDGSRDEIVYSIGEDEVPMYTARVSGYNIINEYNPELTSVSVSKVWEDDNNIRNMRPHSIVMTLSDGQKRVTRVVLDESNGWTATVNNLPTRVNGQEAKYTWTEQRVLGYDNINEEIRGGHTTFTNKLWERPEAPTQGRKPKIKGTPLVVFDDYDTPLGVEVIINHVGDCFD